MHQPRRSWGIKLGGLLLALASTSPQADQYHYNNVLIGDRAVGLGGAYVAIADDPSGLYYNPAGTVFAQGSGFSASANAFHMTRTRYKGVLGANDWVRTSQVLLPNFFGMIQPLGPGVAGFSYAVTDSSLEDQDQRFYNTPDMNNVFDINFNNQDNTYNIGPSYAFKINKHVSVGLTLYGHYRKQEQIFNQQYQLTDDDFTLDANGRRQVNTVTPEITYQTNSTNKVDTTHWINAYKTLSEYGIKPILGIIISPMDKISLGITVSKTALLQSKTELQQSCYTTDFNGIEEIVPDNVAPNDILDQTGLCQYNKVQVAKYASNYEREFPLTVSGGIAYFASPRLLLSGNVTAYQAMYGSTQPLLNYAGGFEFYINGQWALRGGMFTNFANTPTLTSGKTGQAEHIDMFGGSFSVTNFTRTTSLSVGISASSGNGEAQVIDGIASIQKAEVLSVTGFISTAYSF